MPLCNASFTGICWSWLLLHLAAASPDPRCPEPSCCTQPDDGSCWHHGLWTISYCCASGGAADCYRWGEDSPGEDLALHSTHSGVQCRHLCQAHETCAYWTYIVNAPQVPENLRGQCFLKASTALNNRVLAHPFVVSGERLCRYFGEGLSLAAAQERDGLKRPVWRTSLSGATVQAGLLAKSGTAEWFSEAVKVLDEVGFVTRCDRSKLSFALAAWGLFCLAKFGQHDERYGRPHVIIFSDWTC